MTLKLKKIKLDLNVEWKISRGSSHFKENFIVSLGEFESEVAPNIRYGETTESIETAFESYLKDPAIINDEKFPRSLKNAISNLELKKQGDTYKVLDLKKNNEVVTSFSIPIMEASGLESYLAGKLDFKVYKCKISDHRDLSLITELARLTKAPIRVDANEGFQTLESFLDFQEDIKDFNIEFIEQPFPANKKDLYRALKGKNHHLIFADESVEHDFDPEEFKQMFDGINVKLMKAGGIERAKYLLEKAKDHNLKTMLGCMIETSLGISEALVLAELVDYFDLDGHLFLKDDPYSHLLEVDEGILKLK